MLVVRVGSLTNNVVTQLDKGKAFGELAKTANDQSNVPPLIAIIVKTSFQISACTVLRGSLV